MQVQVQRPRFFLLSSTGCSLHTLPPSGPASCPLPPHLPCSSRACRPWTEGSCSTCTAL